MADQDVGRRKPGTDTGRRALLKAATVAGGAAAASALLPGSWRKPLATIGGLPAHAQVSQAIVLRNAAARNWPYLAQAPAPLGDPQTTVYTRCDYEDLVGDFGPDHEVTVTFTPAATAAVGLDPCAAQTYPISGLPHHIEGDGNAGTIWIDFPTVCLPLGSVRWRIRRGSHTSNLADAQILRE